jgi:hypothetical protein
MQKSPPQAGTFVYAYFINLSSRRQRIAIKKEVIPSHALSHGQRTVDGDKKMV